MVALGTDVAGMWSSSDKLASQLEAAAKTTDEKYWPTLWRCNHSGAVSATVYSQGCRLGTLGHCRHSMGRETDRSHRNARCNWLNGAHINGADSKCTKGRHRLRTSAGVYARGRHGGCHSKLCRKFYASHRKQSKFLPPSPP